MHHTPIRQLVFQYIIRVIAIGAHGGWHSCTRLDRLRRVRDNMGVARGARGAGRVNVVWNCQKVGYAVKRQYAHQY
jgi:hypothetical protein